MRQWSLRYHCIGQTPYALESDLPCHAEVSKKQPAWKSAEKRLKLLGNLVHAIDLHPFASFLTTLNVLFMVLPLYVVARKQDPDFTMDLHVFSADGLEDPDRKQSSRCTCFPK